MSWEYDAQMIQVKDVIKKYSGNTALNGVSFSVSQGEVVGLLGPNGAGKTTMMRILTCFMPPTSGSVSVAGFNVFENPDEIKKKIGYVPEHPPLYHDMTVKEFLLFVAGIKRAGLKNFDETVSVCGIQDVLGRLIANLSKGFKQRVVLAQALINDPALLILDEPTIGLDPAQVIEIRNLIRQVSGKKTVLLSSHILSEVEAVCGRVIIIDKGKVVYQDAVENLAAPADSRIKVKIKCTRLPNNFQDEIGTIDGLYSVESLEEAGTFLADVKEAQVEAVSRHCIERGWGLIELVRLRPNLEELFLRLTKQEGTGGKT